MNQENKIVWTSDNLTSPWAYTSGDQVASMRYSMDDLSQVNVNQAQLINTKSEL